MEKIKVLVVDDAVIIRKILSEDLATDSEIDIVGVAANGKIALQKIPLTSPDIITLDIEMPEMDGLQTLDHIKRLYPSIPVIMFSSLTEHGAAATLEALSRGASDYATKPAVSGGGLATRDAVRVDLLRKIKALARARRDGSLPNKPILRLPEKGSMSGTIAVPRAPTPSRKTIDAVVIGVSTGGPNALGKVIPLLPMSLPVPVLVVQHMPPMFTRLLAERLGAQSQVKVFEGADGMPVRPGCVYIAPGDHHMTLSEDKGPHTLTLNQDSPEHSCRPSVDTLFRSAVDAYGGNLLGIILTGMGQDGTQGCGRIRDAGGTVLVQDKPSSVVWGMPGSVYERGLADRVLPLEGLASEIIRLVMKSRTTVQSSLRPLC